jgi:hypothetical protein
MTPFQVFALICGLMLTFLGFMAFVIWRAVRRERLDDKAIRRIVRARLEARDEPKDAA